MEMEFATQLASTIERLVTAAGLLEQAAETLTARITAGETSLTANAEATMPSSQPSNLDRIVATVEPARDTELAARLAAAEHRVAELEARAAAPEAATGRKTLAATSASLFAKHGMTADTIQAGALDAALVHLSLEQRIAVKAELMRAGIVG